MTPSPLSDDDSLPDLAQGIQRVAQRLHAVPSRTDNVQIASEVIRLNDAVREAAGPHHPLVAPPGDFLAELLRLSDSTKEQV